ncbi:MAG: DUF305 domain-containing protein [Mycobacterium sp.]
MNKTRTVATGAAALAAVAVIGACGNSATKEATSSAAPTSTQTSASAQASVHNQADMNFAHMMIPHHQQAIEMSDIVLAKQGIDPRVVNLAKQIKAAQGPEIEKMQGWMTAWGTPMSSMPSMSDMPGMDHGGMHGSESGSATTTTTPTPSGSTMPGMSGMGDMGAMPGMSGMEGMMSPAEMDALKNAQGVEAGKLFLTGMIKHHQGALTMAQDEIKNGQSPGAIALAKSILDSQQKEIDTMNQILTSL